MTENEALTSTYPPPPPYYRLYKDKEDQSPQDVIPPSPPTPPHEYCLFGTTYQKGDEERLEEPMLPATPLFPPSEQPDRKVELKKQCSSLLLSFYHLLDVLVHDQDSFYIKTADIELLLQNITYLLNTFRPHQARQAILQVFREQMEAKSLCVEEAHAFHGQYRQVSAELVGFTRNIHLANLSQSGSSPSRNNETTPSRMGGEKQTNPQDLDLILSALQEVVDTEIPT